MRVEDSLRDHARRSGAGHVPGLAAGRLSFAELDDASERLAGVLEAQGISPGDRVALLMDNAPAGLVALFAGLKAGAGVCPVHLDADCEDLSFVLNDCPVACLIVDARFAPIAAAAMAEAPLLRLVVIAGAEGAPAVDGLMRYEDAILAEARALPSPGSAVDAALHLYPKQAAAGGPCRTISHEALLGGDAALTVVHCLDATLIAVIAAMRGEGGLAGVAA